MTSKEIYESIDQSKLSPKGRDFLKSVEKNTKGFTKQNDKVDSVLKKLYADLKAKKPEALKDVTTKTVEKEVRVPTTKSERKKEPKKKTKIVKEKVEKATGKKKVTKPTKTPSTPKESKVEHISSRASKLAKKEGISFKEARARLSKDAKEQIKKDEKEADKELDKLLKFVRKDVFEDGEKYPKIYGKQDPEKSSLSADAKRMAKPVGKRVSKNGKTYYEYRDNRSDRNSLPAPKGQYKYKGKTPPFLADGGAIDSLKKDMNSKLDIHSDYYAEGGEIDLFEQYDKQPKKLSKIVEKYEERYADGDMDYKDTEKFLKEVNAIGYTFDSGLDNEPYNLRPMMAKGGRTISIVNDGVKFDKSKYKAVYGDFDKDGIVNIDDANPLDKTKSGQVEGVELRKTFDKLLGVKAELDEIMYDAVETLDEKAPKGADIYARTKTPYSILKKLVEKRMLDPKRGLTDMIGTTIAVDNQKELEKVRDDIDGGLLGKVLDRDDFYKTPNAGYMAYHYIVEYKGVPVEVQLKTKNMKKLHEVSHEAYKNGTLNAKSLDSLSKTFMRADKGDAKAKAEISRLLSDKKLLASKISKSTMAKGGKIGFDGLAKKVAKRYEGKPVKSEFQNEYGKTYNKKEAMEVGRKVAGKVYRQQQSMEKGGVMKTYDDFGKDYDAFTDYVMDRISLEERRKIRDGWNKKSRENREKGIKGGNEMRWENYLLKRVNEKSYAKGGEVLEYSKILDILTDKIDDAVEDIESTYEQATNPKGEEVESKSRDGFIPFTNGGYSSKWFEYSNMLEGSGMNLPTNSLDETIEEFRERNREIGFERFEEEYPEIVEELGGIENVNYSELEDAGYGSEAEELDEFMRDDDDSVMMEVEAFYYTPNNDRGENGKHTIQLSGVVNLEAPYHRSGNLEDYIEERFTFDTLKELEDKLDKGLAKVVSWFEGDMYDKNPRELKIRRMEAGGTLPTPFGQAGLVGETGAMNEMDLFAMGGGLPQGVHQYYGQTYNPAYPTPHGYAKGGEVADINKFKKQLIAKAKRKGLYENFGQAEVGKLEDKYGYSNNVREFDNWAMNFDLSQMAKGGDVYDLRASKEMIEKEIQQLQIRRPNALTDLERFRIDKKIRQNKEILKNRGNYAGGGEIDAFIMKFVKDAPASNLRVDSQELTAKLKKGGKLGRSKHSLMQDRRRVSSESWEVAYQKRKSKMEAGGTLPTPFGQAGLVGETGAMNEMDMFAMGGGLPQGVHQYYANTYNPAYPTPHGYAKGGKISDKLFFVKNLFSKDVQYKTEDGYFKIIIKPLKEDRKYGKDFIGDEVFYKVPENELTKDEVGLIFVESSNIWLEDSPLEVEDIEEKFGVRLSKKAKSIYTDTKKAKTEKNIKDVKDLSEMLKKRNITPKQFNAMTPYQRKSILTKQFIRGYAKGGLITNQSEKHLMQVLIGLGMKSKSIFDKNKPYFGEEDRELLRKMYDRLDEEQFAKGGEIDEYIVIHTSMKPESFIKKHKLSNYEYEIDETEYDGFNRINFETYPKNQNFLTDKTIKEFYYEPIEEYAKGGKTQGYNDKLDESLGNTKGKRSTKEQNYKDRRNESEAMEKKGGKRKYASVKTMDKGSRKKRITPMSVAKEIRKEGEEWQDAVKRASAMLKKK